MFIPYFPFIIFKHLVDIFLNITSNRFTPYSDTAGTKQLHAMLDVSLLTTCHQQVQLSHLPACNPSNPVQQLHSFTALIKRVNDDVNLLKSIQNLQQHIHERADRRLLVAFSTQLHQDIRKAATLDCELHNE